MRAIGIGFLGLIGGLLFAIVVQDILAPLLIYRPGSPSPLWLILGASMPAFGIAGAGLAIWIDRRRKRITDKGNRSSRQPTRPDDRGGPSSG